MLDTMTLTKVLGAMCGSLLIFLLGAWFAEELYHVGPHIEHHADDHGDDHGDGHKVLKQAYSIEVEGAETEEVVEVAFADIYSNANAASGEKIFRKCSACHKLEQGVNGTGPYLYGLVGREIASVDGFAYSGALAGADGNWTPEEINEFLTNPSNYLPGTSMNFKLGKIEDRADVIAYLSTIGG
ncbi:MAG: cytochrome c family protein [Pseudomonadota bacterium]